MSIERDALTAFAAANTAIEALLEELVVGCAWCGDVPGSSHMCQNPVCLSLKAWFDAEMKFRTSYV